MKLNEAATKERYNMKEQYAAVFSEKLRIALAENERYKSAKQLADAAGLSAVMLSAFMTGAKLPTLITAIQIADALDVSLDDLLGRGNAYTKISESPTLESLVKNLIVMDDADVIDLKAPHGVDKGFAFWFRDERINDFLGNYCYLSQKLRHDGEEGRRFFEEWLAKQYAELRTESVTIKIDKESTDR